MIPIRSFSGEAAIGGGLMLTPWWAKWLHVVAGVAGDLAAICGFIIGVHAIYRLVRARMNPKNDDKVK